VKLRILSGSQTVGATHSASEHTAHYGGRGRGRGGFGKDWGPMRSTSLSDSNVIFPAERAHKARESTNCSRTPQPPWTMLVKTLGGDGRNTDLGDGLQNEGNVEGNKLTR
jgi:hypothetical protein